MTTPALTVLGLDIGGANLKAADGRGYAVSRPFALWRHPERLSDELRALDSEFPRADLLAVTMTGELCDCFPTRSAGVRAILDAVAAIADARPVRIWMNTGTFVTPFDARRDPLAAASANWLALATYAGRFAPTGPAVLVDVGTTTTDVIRLQDGVPRPVGRTDPERLASGELLYRGWKRTPLTALVDDRFAAEFFATTHDVCLALGKCAEDPSDTDTADGRPATRKHALSRLARMSLADAETMSEREIMAFARGVYERLCEQIRGRIPPGVSVIASGSGAWLVGEVCDETSPPNPLSEAERGSRQRIEERAGGKSSPPAVLSCPPPLPLGEGGRGGGEVSSCACAHAVAVHALEEHRR